LIVVLVYLRLVTLLIRIGMSLMILLMGLRRRRVALRVLLLMRLLLRVELHGVLI
jgi:hypothetical protein